jgi:N,N'-diacetyllegionaminate synthase
VIIGDIDTEKKVLIIAEIGNNHEGNMDNAIRLVQEAAKCGVDAVKFQTYKTEHYVSQADPARFARLKSFELSYTQFEELSKLAHSLNLLFLSTPFDLNSARFLETIVDGYKIASGDINFYPLLDVVASTEKPILVSTGASHFNLIKSAVDRIATVRIKNNRPSQLALLHCTSCYPVPADQVNLQSIQFLNDKFNHTVGYSDHTIGIEASLTAIALGARIIEKHFTLSKSFSSFRDHQLSSDPSEMRELIQKVHLVSTMIGNGDKKIQTCEAEMMPAIRRSIVAGSDLSAGHIITLGDLTWIRPANGIPPGEEYKLLGKKLKTNKKFGNNIFEDDVE